jgi:hypothetical protein
MGKWNNRERVMAALNGQEPDQVPYCELKIDPVFAAKLLGRDEKPYLDASDEET